MYSFILIQLVYVIAGMMDPIRFVMLLCMGTYNCVFFYFNTACFAGAMDFIRFVILLRMYGYM